MWTDVKDMLPPCVGSNATKLVKSCVIAPSTGAKRNGSFPEHMSVKAALVKAYCLLLKITR